MLTALGFFETLSENLLGRPIKPVYGLAGWFLAHTYMYVVLFPHLPHTCGMTTGVQEISWPESKEKVIVYV